MHVHLCMCFEIKEAGTFLSRAVDMKVSFYHFAIKIYVGIKGNEKTGKRDVAPL